jgi:hypothetical protein
MARLSNFGGNQGRHDADPIQVRLANGAPFWIATSFYQPTPSESAHWCFQWWRLTHGSLKNDPKLCAPRVGFVT